MTDKTCLFCRIAPALLIAENELACVIRDAFPVVELHSLIISKRHVADFFGLDAQEREACHALLEATRRSILAKDATVEGFNVGINSGEAAGQTIYHSHIHLIPRRRGDVRNPRGGVRHVILGKGFY